MYLLNFIPPHSRGFLTIYNRNVRSPAIPSISAILFKSVQMFCFFLQSALWSTHITRSLDLLQCYTFYHARIKIFVKSNWYSFLLILMNQRNRKLHREGDNGLTQWVIFCLQLLVGTATLAWGFQNALLFLTLWFFYQCSVHFLHAWHRL